MLILDAHTQSLTLYLSYIHTIFAQAVCSSEMKPIANSSTNFVCTIEVTAEKKQKMARLTCFTYLNHIVYKE